MYRVAIERLLSAREEVSAARRDEIWARLFPDGSARSEPPTAMVAGGVISRLRAAVPGLQVTFGMPELRRLLEADVEFVASAVTSDQKQALAAREPAAKSSLTEAIRTQTEEGQEVPRREQRERQEAYRREWGVYPS